MARSRSAGSGPAAPPANRRAALLVGLLPWSLAACARAAADAGAARLPAFAYRSKPVQYGYRFATEQPGLLAQLPCYCGCARLARPHASLRDCFIDPQGGYDSHAAGCTTCIDEALDAKQLLAAGRSPAQIRAAIDATYAGRGTPTGTPPIVPG